MRAVDVVPPCHRASRKPPAATKIVQTAFRRGLLLLGCGENAIRVLPPLCVSAAQIDTTLQLLDDMVTTTPRRAKPPPSEIRGNRLARPLRRPGFFPIPPKFLDLAGDTAFPGRT